MVSFLFLQSSTSNLGESINAENLLKFTLRPHTNLGIDRSCILTQVTSSQVVNELLSEIPELKDKTEEIKQLWLTESNTVLPSCLEKIRRDDMETACFFRHGFIPAFKIPKRQCTLCRPIL
ncbi:unnamed protein product [Arabis nemorensis]|uniref:Uncharacterized protein n=1 Tax=Arabis nemorensis TaxID=586526 RepID=A0A565CP24_9BRAS|nr:unnamed protein product [Arabis nemorensis]